MKASELSVLEVRVRRAYELARLRKALLGFAPMLLLVAAAVIFGGRSEFALAMGPILFAGGVFALWYGREPGLGVLPGALAGGTALLVALCANRIGHFCTGEQCMSWCLPACVASGVLAGGFVSFVGLRQRAGTGYWLTASGITLLTGALGCSCVGFAGMIGLLGGFVGAAALSSVASLLRRPSS